MGAPSELPVDLLEGLDPAARLLGGGAPRVVFHHPAVRLQRLVEEVEVGVVVVVGDVVVVVVVVVVVELVVVGVPIVNVTSPLLTL